MVSCLMSAPSENGRLFQVGEREREGGERENEYASGSTLS